VNACEELDVASHMGTEVKVDLGAHLALRSSAMPSRRVSAKGEILADFPTETPMVEVLEEDDIAALVRRPLAHAMPSNVVNVTGDHHAASAMEMMLEVDIAEALLAHLELAMPFNGVNANAETRAVTHTVETEEIISPATHHLVAVELVAFQRGECDRGDSCRFSHEAGGGDYSPRSTGVCYAFQRGECERGTSCRFAHEAATEMAY